MAERPEVRRKRALSEEDNNDNNESNSEFDSNTPKIADAATMAQRRIVRVRRSPPNETAPSSSIGTAFKGITGISPAAVPALSTKFGLSDNNNNNDNNKSSSGDVTATPALATHNFSFGGQSLPSGVFSSFPASGKFTFGTLKNNDSTKDNEGDNISNSNDNSGAEAPKFGQSFNFGAAVNSFMEAKAKLAKSNTETDETTTTTAPSSFSVNESTINTNDALANATPVEHSTGEVLVSISSKLFIFKSETKTWAECGAGDAKVKRHELNLSGETESKVKKIYRLIVRDGYALNAPLNVNFHLTKTEDTHVIFAIPAEEKKIATYLLKYTGQNVAERGAEFTKILKDTLKLAQEESD